VFTFANFFVGFSYILSVSKKNRKTKSQKKFLSVLFSNTGSYAAQVRLCNGNPSGVGSPSATTADPVLNLELIITTITNMKLKYLALIGLLCAGLTPLAHALLTDLGEHTLPNAGDKTELNEFISLSGDTTATICEKSNGFTSSSGLFTITLNPDNTIQVTWDLSGTGREVCGFGTKDGSGVLEHFYSVSADEGVSGSFSLEVPGNGGSALSHLDVFCCPGGSVPDSGTTAMLLGGALTGLGAVRRYLGRK
jgi:VPDSG-CTERM motif